MNSLILVIIRELEQPETMSLLITTLFYFIKAMQQKKYSLSWHTYSDHLKSMMKELMMNENFSDVTLVTEDKKQIKANINILSACSPVFKDILKKEKNLNTIMYLKGVQYSELESIIQFMYLGEATFYEERMGEVLAVAKLLEIKGLCNAGAESYDYPDEYRSQNDPDTQTEERMDEVLDGTESNGYLYDYSSSNDPEIPTELVEEKSKLFDNIKNQDQQERKESSIGNTGAYECDQCFTPYSSPGVLNAHKQSIHQGVRYACDQCDKLFTDQGNLRRHIRSKHNGVRYVCDQCGRQFKDQGNVKKHILSKHEGVEFAYSIVK